MPLYSYKCTGCGKISTDLRSMEARNHVTNCSECGKERKRNLADENVAQLKIIPLVE